MVVQHRACLALAAVLFVEGGSPPLVRMSLERHECAATTNGSSLCGVLQAASAGLPLAPATWTNPPGLKEGGKQLPPPPLALAGEAVPEVQVPLQNNFNLIYTAVADIGEPSVKVRLIVDTGSSDLWLKASSVAAPFGGGHVYDPLRSPTALASRGPVHVSYGAGHVDGREFRDSVCLQTLCVENQSMVFADNVFGIPDQWLFDGILGLGYAPLARDQYGQTFLQSLAVKFRTLGIGFSLGAGDGLGGGAFLAIGELKDLQQEAVAQGLGDGITMRLYGVNHQALYWMVPASIAVAWPPQGALRGAAPPPAPMTLLSQTSPPAMAILDSGTTLISAPSAAYAQLISAMVQGRPETFQKCTTTLLGGPFGLMMCLCDVQLNPVTFSLLGIDGRKLEVTLQAQDLMQIVGVGAIGAGVCRVNIIPSPPGMPLWILGDVFLKHVYAIHDVPNHMLHIYPQQASRAAVILGAGEEQDAQRGPPGLTTLILALAGMSMIAAATVCSLTIRGLRQPCEQGDLYSAL